jgi:hypothetical protein
MRYANEQKIRKMRYAEKVMQKNKGCKKTRQMRYAKKGM